MTAKCLLLFGTAMLLSGKDVVLTEGGRVSIDFVATEAGYRNTVFLVSATFPGGSTVKLGSSGCNTAAVQGGKGLALVTDKLAALGCRVTLDSDPSTTNQIDPFPANTSFELGLCVDKASSGTCDDFWSSNPNKNSDRADRLLQEPIRPERYKGVLIRLGWEDSTNSIDQDFNDAVLYLRVERDSDGDGLWDDWEEFGIDTDGDGEIDFKLPGANPGRKDVYLEIDYMGKSSDGTHDHKPSQQAIDIVVNAFANAPVNNPDGSTGITLHVDVSNEIPHKDLVVFGKEFEELKEKHFNQKSGRRLVYRYAIFGHSYDETGSGGVAETPGDDLMVTLTEVSVGRVEEKRTDVGPGGVAGTLMHELGHTLGLRHGGNDNINRKPNYRSVMNYNHQYSGVPFWEASSVRRIGGEARQIRAPKIGYRYDFSRIKLPTLNEAALHEPDPFYPVESLSTRRNFKGENGNDEEAVENPAILYNCHLGRITGPVPDGLGLDWNCNGNRGDRSVQVDLNGESGTRLNGHNDWENLVYTFQNDPLRFGGVYPEPGQLEQSPQQAAEAEKKIIFAPVAAIQPITIPVLIRQIELDGSLSVVPGGGEIASYQWRVIGMPAALTNERGPRVVVQFGGGPGEYRFELTVTAKNGLTSVATTTVVYLGR